MKRSKKPDLSASSGEATSIPYRRIVLCLLVICVVCSALLGATYLFTQEPIRQNEESTIQALLISIYGEDAVFESGIAVPQGQNAEAIYLSRNADHSLRGYAIRILSRGFSDDIDLIVGFNADGSVRKIEIISMSETAGLGSLVGEGEYLSQYIGKSGELTLKEDIDAISGATKSSRALLAGVNQATACLKALGV